MVTRLYLHSTNSPASGTLPSTKQSAQTVQSGGGSQTVNKFMTTTIGTAQTSTTAAESSGYLYFTRFVSDILSAQTIAANTWTINYAFADPGSAGPSNIRVCIYVWRPSNGTRVGFIADTSVTASNPFSASEACQAVTVSGSSLAVQNNDLLCVEVIADNFGGGSNMSFYYDGTTVTTTAGTIVSNHASFIETPQTLIIGLRNLTTSISQSISFVSDHARTKNIQRPLSQSIALASSMNRPRRQFSLSHSISFSNSLTRVRNKYRPISEAISLTHDLLRSGETKIKNLFPSIQFTDTYAKITTRLRPVSDSISITGQTNDYRQRNKAISDSIGFSDGNVANMVRNKWRQFNDAITMSDTYQTLTTRIRSFLETIQFVDNESGSKLKNRSFSNSISLSDSNTKNRQKVGIFNAPIQFTDTYTKITTRIRTLAPSVSLTSVHNPYRNKIKAISDSINLASTHSKLKVRLKTLAASISFTDSLTRVRMRYETLSESINLATTYQKMTTRIRIIAHPIQFLDSFNNNLPTGPRSLFVRLITYIRG